MDLLITKFFLVFTIVTVSAQNQRPSFAGSSPKGVPNVATRFQTGDSESNVIAADVANRLGTDGTTARLPVDSRGDVDLVNRIKDWPRENQPFWYVNAEAIEKQKGSTNVNKPTTVNNANQGFSGRPTLDNASQLENRFAADSQSRPEINSVNSFNVVINNQWKTYVYDPVTDAWYAKKN